MAIIITDEDARRHLSMKECIDAMRVCFRDFADGNAVSLPRVRYTIDNGDEDKSYYANVHVGAVPSFGVACVRAGSHVIDNTAYSRDRRSMRNPEPVNWAVVVLYDIKTSEPIAFMHESHVSGMRVGATTGIAVDAIARAAAAVLGLMGTGRQARAHLEAICAGRPIRRVQVFSPNPVHLEAFIKASAHTGVEVLASASAQRAAEGADIVCSTTNSTSPVIEGAWLQPGQMVISIGNSDPTITRHEVDEETFARADDIVVNDWESVHANRQIELLERIDSGLVDRDRVHVLADIVAGTATVNSKANNIVYYKSNTGLAMQFAAAGAILIRKLEATGTNRIVPREWLMSDQYGIG